MNHHGTRDRHNSLDGSLSMTILMMTTNPSKPGNLLEDIQMLNKSFTGERTSIIREKFGRNNTMITTVGHKSCLGIQGSLHELYVNIVRGMINKNTSTTILVFI
jgi:hypothetical protein